MIFATLPCILALAVPVGAQPPLPEGLLGAEIRSGWEAQNGTRIAALHLQLAPGWKTYWRVPGEAGVPPVLHFARSRNLAHMQVIWPTPSVFEQNGMRTVGYHDELILPLELTPREAGVPIDLEARLDFGICHEICVPVQLDLTAWLAGPGAPDPAIAAALEAQPVPRPGLARCAVEPIRDGMRVEARIDTPPAPGEVALFELRARPMWVSDPMIAREGGTLLASAEFVPETGAPFDLDQDDLRITVVSAAGAIEIDGCPPN
ncbi:DsbC/DsbD-like thiol-disulfide interchange protein [Rhodobacter aestuarii]|uniref:Thiol-disulfide interchange protein, contains DsbC and DsbD domains n=1 Tax=Rhodobacter aestuarii TaxID=453582 RepID=A0A1N7KBZ8_9RHOB|nr:protein-disulfide reductase DsbD domain-containing protein [Rhodobacter aestuarii]PTV95767.1 DsbC/DsbD-like thiol-disulfide interchange protein [Rhodobacter aestuarii]SIS59138.1 Thiol-disulfide interchange protein, contains DsbC and DsbD domains [Rhodobacter aestuarii]